MNGALAAQAAQAVQENSHDPLMVFLVSLAGLIVGIVAVGKPLMGIYREYKQTGTVGAKAAAEDSLYENLKKQLDANTNAIGVLQSERDAWFAKATRLESEVERLKAFEQMVESMKSRLNEKDKIIESREREIRELMNNMLSMKDRIHALELRLQADELRFCRDCEFKKGT